MVSPSHKVCRQCIKSVRDLYHHFVQAQKQELDNMTEVYADMLFVGGDKDDPAMQEWRIRRCREILQVSK
jgi:hypothetical protein